MILPRTENQPWRDAVIAQRERYGLAAEVTAMFDDMKFNGATDEAAALTACQSWDVLEVEW